MSIDLRSRRAAGALGVAALMLGVATPAALGLPVIPDNDLVSSDQRQLIHIRIQTGCDEQSTDQVEVQIPPDVIGVLAEAVPGWAVESEVEPTDPYELFGQEQTERTSLVRWSGGSVPAGQFLDFGISAVFRKAPVELAFPVTQHCGDAEVAWTEVADGGADPSDLRFPAPVVTVVSPAPSVDVATLQERIEELETEVERLPRIADRVQELEAQVDELQAALGAPSPET
jgi:uncharacterized protein YcnI